MATVFVLGPAGVTLPLDFMNEKLIFEHPPRNGNGDIPALPPQGKTLPP
jgi:hypothetical protein